MSTLISSTLTVNMWDISTKKNKTAFQISTLTSSTLTVNMWDISRKK